ncbi:MAG TPA: GNAT family protein [Pseudomonadales bacterium]|nr:GNAT family protein [Pseudomonadales bacterium]
MAASKPIILTGKNIFLRPPELTDLREYTALINRSLASSRWLGNPPKGKKRFTEYVRPSPNGEYFRFLICRSEDRRIVGSIGLFLIERNLFQSGCTGYMVGQPNARRGYATEALQLILRFAFRTLKLHRVEANIQPDNVPSLALVKRAGFRLEGYSPRFLKIQGKWRDHERWAILAENWRR